MTTRNDHSNIIFFITVIGTTTTFLPENEIPKHSDRPGTDEESDIQKAIQSSLQHAAASIGAGPSSSGKDERNISEN